MAKYRVGVIGCGRKGRVARAGIRAQPLDGSRCIRPTPILRTWNFTANTTVSQDTATIERCS